MKGRWIFLGAVGAALAAGLVWNRNSAIAATGIKHMLIYRWDGTAYSQS
jgi:hypothetical protein